MAKIEFDAFVEEVLTGANGPWALKTAETHQRKDDAGKWQTVARTFRTVKGQDIDFRVYSKGDRVTVAGNEKTEVREYQDRKFYDLVVWADRVGVSEFGKPVGTASSGNADVPPATESADVWNPPATEYDGSIPF